MNEQQEKLSGINLDWYISFIYVARLQNYHRAAEELFTSQTTIFNHVKKLEALLHVSLFKRTGQNIRLTEAGKQFYPLAVETIETVQKGIYTLRNSKAGYTKHLNVAVSTYVASYLIPRFLPIFFRHAPHIDLAISVVDTGMEQQLISNIYDIGIQRNMPSSNKLSYKNICEGSIGLIVPNREENKYFRDEIDYFRKYRILCDNHPTYWDKLKTEILFHYNKAHFTSITSVHATEHMIRSNQGISYIPLYILKHTEQTRRDLKVINSIKITNPISFTYMIWKEQNPEAQIFMELFSDYIRLEQT